MSLPAANEYPPAGLLRRLAAMLYDSFLVVALLFVMAIPPVYLNGGEIHTDGSWLGHVKSWAFTLYLLAGTCGFYVWFWTHGGQTLGMAAWRIRVVDPYGRPLGWRAAWLRVISACLGLANVSIWLQPNRLAWHERLSHSRTVKLPKQANASP